MTDGRSATESVDPQREVRIAAVRLLAHREHTREELRRKLTRRGHAASCVEAVIAALDDASYVSDARFAEMFVRVRAERGQGPLRIRAELRERGVAESLADEVLTETADYWLTHARAARRKRFGDGTPSERNEWNRQARFLAQRGYPSDLIFRALSDQVD
jgi:regulatory protein